MVESGKGKYDTSTCIRGYSGLGGREQNALKRISNMYSEVNHSIQRISLFLSSRHVPPSKLHFSPTLLSSPNAILHPTIQCCSQQLSIPMLTFSGDPSKPSRRFLLLLCISACTTIKSEKIFLFPVFIRS